METHVKPGAESALVSWIALEYGGCYSRESKRAAASTPKPKLQQTYLFPPLRTLAHLASDKGATEAYNPFFRETLHELQQLRAMNTDISDFLAEQRDAAPADLQHLFISFEDLWERKLWHQLTDLLIEFFNKKESAPQRLPFYKNFILTFADKINQLKLVTLVLSAATQCKGMDQRFLLAGFG